MTSTALRKTADLVKKIRDKNGESEISGKRNNGISECSVQEYIPVKAIKEGFVITTDGRYLMILEIDSTNFSQMTYDAQNGVMRHFAQLFRKGFVRSSLHILSDRYSPETVFNELNKANANEKNPKRLAMLDTYEQHIVTVSQQASVVRRYFLVVEYTGDEEGNKSSDENEILETLDIMREQTIKSFESARNRVLFDRDDPNTCTANILYYFFNRKSIRRVSFEDRVKRARNDYRIYSKETGVAKKATIIDTIAPRGLRFDDPEYVFQDGMYYTWLGVKSNGWPSQAPFAWLPILLNGQDYNYIDITIRFKMQPQAASLRALKLLSKTRISSMRSKMFKGRQEEASKIGQKIANADALIKALSNSDNLFFADLMITIRGNTKKELKIRKAAYKKAFDNNFDFEDSYMCAEDYYRATLPLLVSSPVTRRLDKQIVSTHIGAMYPFDENKVNHPKGYLLGLCENQPVFIDNFTYPNGNMFVVGTAGSGKTFTECVIGGRYSMNGTRINCICPAKGGEYIGLTKLYGGQFINLAPHQDCINIMEIRNEANIDVEKEPTENVAIANQSYLAKKIRTLISWFILNYTGGAHSKTDLTRAQRGALETLLIKIYEDHGITSDNASLQPVDGKKKTMPILQEWYDAMVGHPVLDEIAYVLEYYVTNKDGIVGTGSNLNGQTNVDLTNKITVYDVSFDEGASIPAEYGPAYLFLAFNSAYDRVKEDIKIRDMIVIDEAWLMMTNEDCGKQVVDAIKLIRSYHGCCIIATQEIQDFINGAGDCGRTVLNICTVKVLMKSSEQSIKLMSDIYNLTKDETITMSDLSRGDALLIADTNKMFIHIYPTKEELDAFNTDREKK